MRHAMNRIKMDREYMPKCIWPTGGGTSKYNSHPPSSERLLTVHRKHSLMGRRLFQSLRCLIRRISPPSGGTRKHGQSILRSEIFCRLGVTDLDQWQFSFLRYCPFRPSSPSPPQPTNSRDKSMPTHFRVYSNSSLSP